MTIEALRQYILSQGASQREIQLEWDKIWSLNKKVIDPIAPRHTALTNENLVPVTMSGACPVVLKELAKHKKNPDVGMKQTLFGPDVLFEQEDAVTLEIDEEITLMDWGNCIITSITKDGDRVTAIAAKLHLEGDFKKTKKKLTWLCASPHASAPIPLILHDFDYLITKKKLEQDDEMADFVTPKTEFLTKCVGDANMKSLKAGDVIQLERKGYYITDSVMDAIHLFKIPDGKAASLVSKAEPTQEIKEIKIKEFMKGARVEVKDNSMYAMSSIYAKEEMVKGNMYAMDSVYADMKITSAAISKNAATAVSAPVETSTESHKASKKEKKAKPPAAAPAAEVHPISKMDICVGVIKSVKKHPDADTLYVEEIDVGEETHRTVVSGLVKFMTPDQMINKTIIVLKNLKPVAMRGIKSYAMVLCASSADHTQVEFLIPPAGCVPGDVVSFDGYERQPEPLLNPKKKQWEAVQPDFSTTADLVAVWKGIPFMTSKGAVKATSIANAQIK